MVIQKVKKYLYLSSCAINAYSTKSQFLEMVVKVHFCFFDEYSWMISSHKILQKSLRVIILHIFTIINNVDFFLWQLPPQILCYEKMKEKKQNMIWTKYAKIKFFIKIRPIVWAIKHADFCHSIYL